MNILFVSVNFPPLDGGIAIFNYHICKELYAQGHKVEIIAKNVIDSEDFDRKQIFKIRRLNTRIRPTSVETISKVLLSTVKEKIDVIFFGLFGSSHWLSGVLAKIIFNTPYVILVHGNDLNAYFNWYTLTDRWASGIVLKNASKVIVNSRSTKKLVQDHGFSSSNIHIIHPGVDTIKFKPSVPESSIIDKFGLKDKKTLLTLSRLAERKNHENVLRALPLVLTKVPDLKYLIIGKGEEEEKLRNIVTDLNLGKYVEFVGYVESNHLPLYYNICDVFIMPSKTTDTEEEGFGIVYTEANACGKPVIAGNLGGASEAVIDGITGILVDPDNIEEISRAIIRLLTNPRLARKLGKNGRKRVEKELNWEIIGKKLENYLKQVIK